MKSFLYGCALLLVLFSASLPAHAQWQELQELALDIEKLRQLKQLLNDMYKGYEVLKKGYSTVKDLTEGNFNLHQLFLDRLLQVSPLISQYEHTLGIVSCQSDLVREYKQALSQLKATGSFSATEVGYCQDVYHNLVSRSLTNLDELLMIITAGKLRMNDAERMAAIDRIYNDMEDKLVFLRHFNNQARILSLQRGKEQQENTYLKKLYETP